MQVPSRVFHISWDHNILVAIWFGFVLGRAQKVEGDTKTFGLISNDRPGRWALPRLETSINWATLSTLGQPGGIEYSSTDGSRITKSRQKPGSRNVNCTDLPKEGLSKESITYAHRTSSKISFREGQQRWYRI